MSPVTRNRKGGRMRRRLILTAIVCVLAVGMRSDVQADFTFTTIDPPETTYTNAQGVNDSGQIVGEYYTAGHYHGFLYDGTAFSTIDCPGADATTAFAINTSGQIVGRTYSA